MNGAFKTIIMDKDAVIEMYASIKNEEGNPVALAMEGKSKTKYDEEITVWVPAGSKMGTFNNVSGYQKRGTW